MWALRTQRMEDASKLGQGPSVSRTCHASTTKRKWRQGRTPLQNLARPTSIAYWMVMVLEPRAASTGGFDDWQLGVMDCRCSRWRLSPGTKSMLHTAGLCCYFQCLRARRLSEAAPSTAGQILPPNVPAEGTTEGDVATSKARNQNSQPCHERWHWLARRAICQLLR